MKNIVLPLAACAAVLCAPMAEAAVLGVFTNDYGNGPGQIDPQGTDAVSRNFVRIRDDQPVADQFVDSFDFSSLAGSVIDSLDFTLTFDQAGPSFFRQELWLLNILGSDPGNVASDFNAVLSDAQAPLTITLNAGTDTASNDAFSTAVQNLSLGFNFDEIFGLPNDSFRLFSASLTVNGTAPAPVPLPMPAFLLMGAIGGLGLLRRRKASAA